MKIIDAKHTLKIIDDKFSSGERFHFTRFGDGDYFTLIDRSCHGSFPEGAIGTIAGRHNRFDVTAEYQNELIESYNIDDPNYMIASIIGQKEFHFSYGKFLQGHVDEKCNEGILHKHEKFYCHHVFVHAFKHQISLVKNLINTHIKNKRTMYIGDAVSENFEKLFGRVDVHVRTPETNSYATIDEWWQHVEASIDDVDIVFLCSGFSSRIISKRIWELDKDIICLDLGSIVSAIRGQLNRVWFQNDKKHFATAAIMKKFE